MFNGADNTQQFELIHAISVLHIIQKMRCECHSMPTIWVRCSNAHPKPLREASHFIRVSKSGLKCLFWVVSAIFSLINAHLLAGIIEFKFLPIFTQGLHFAVFVIMSLCMYGHHVWVAISVIPHVPG